MADDLELRAAWAEHLGDDVAGRAAFDELVGRHREPHRRYHGVHHVTWVVRHVRSLAADVAVDDLGSVIAAAFFHDAVYDPRAADNEAQSAELAGRVLAELGWVPARIDAVAAMIRATAAHQPTDAADEGVLLDADLAVLGSEPAAYQAYVTGVRAEYAHVDDDAWRVGRGAVLDGLLDADPLYSTAPARQRWQARARANLTAERVTLR